MPSMVPSFTQSSWICFQQVVFADADCALAVGDCAAP